MVTRSKFSLPSDFVQAAGTGPTPTVPVLTAEQSPQAAAVRPWDGLDPRIIKAFQLRLPAPLHAKLKYLGETTAGESSHSIVLEAIEEAVARRLAERES
jgi:hypothetical protein